VIEAEEQIKFAPQIEDQRPLGEENHYASENIQ
jgi:hypothetical protein